MSSFWWSATIKTRPCVHHLLQAFVDQLRIRIDEVKVKDSEWKEIVKKQRKRRTVKVDSDLSGFIDE